MKNLIQLTVLITSLLLCLSSLNSISAQTNDEENEFGLPADMGDGKTVLLVQLNGKKLYDKRIIKQMEKEFTGKYDYLTVPKKSKLWYDYPTVERPSSVSHTLLNEPKFEGKFEDVEKYRYFLGQYYIVYRDLSNRKTSHSCRYYILDRVTGEKYNCPKTSIASGKLFRNYVKAIDGNKGK